ncbi:MAG TPA: radical SAM family heme chaperone HemW [Thermoanaerobaculia bacterium]|jgi:oxygen-independent coproporphyrinogen-3 oxidase
MAGVIGVYVHLPFCRVHCSYCPFAISTDIELQDRYVDAVEREILGSAADSAADTVYLGGGTPSRTSIANLQRIVKALNIAPGAEFSMEANPEDVTPEALDAWRELGVNRISIGVQSFNDEELKAIGRIHDAAGAVKAIEAASSAMRTNLDLILGLPHQTRESFAQTLDQAIALEPGHLSLYMLDLDETTPLQVQVAKGRVTVPEDDMVADQYQYAIARLEEAGLHQYEISNFAREGEECLHNLRYWTRGEYRGFGLAAHSFVDERRFANTRNIHEYIADPEHARNFEEHLGDDERRRETLFLSLRRKRGINYDELVALCGQEAIEWVSRGLRDGWLERHEGRVAFTPSGFLLSNDYISQLF